MQRDKIFRRIQRKRHIRRKKRILKEANLWEPKCIGMLSKGKIHCSCHLCSAKYVREPSISDKKRLQKYRAKYEEMNF